MLFALGGVEGREWTGTGLVCEGEGAEVGLDGGVGEDVAEGEGAVLFEEVFCDVREFYTYLE